MNDHKRSLRRDRLIAALKKLAASHPDNSGMGYVSTHPDVDERVRHLYEASGQPESGLQ
jgi:Zn-dependent protease with chaperone function